jgi:hypothetical protein
MPAGAIGGGEPQNHRLARCQFIQHIVRPGAPEMGGFVVQISCGFRRFRSGRGFGSKLAQIYLSSCRCCFELWM